MILTNPPNSPFQWLCRIGWHRFSTLVTAHHRGWLEGRYQLLEYQVQICSRCGQRRTLVGDCE